MASTCQLIFWVTVGLIKISISLFSRRLTGLTWMVAHNIFLFLLVGYVILALFINLFECLPFEHFSIIEAGRFSKPAKCFETNSLNIVLTCIHIIFDFALLSVRLIVLYQMQMSTMKKLRLAFLFSIGALSCIGAIIRPIVVAQGNPDIMYAFQVQYSWTTTDMFFAITAASLPVLNAAVPKG